MREITVKSTDECKNRNTPQMFTLVHFMPNKISVIYVLLAVKVGGMAWWCPNEGRIAESHIISREYLEEGLWNVSFKVDGGCRS